MKALKPIKAAAKELERIGLLDKEDPTETAAFAALASPLLQYGLDLLKVAHNHHPTPRVRKIAGTGGVPVDRERDLPHPGPVSRFPPQFDARREYEQATFIPMETAGAAARRDPLAGRPRAQQRRAVLVQQQLGGCTRKAWQKLLADDLDDFCAAFAVYVSCV